MKKIFFVVLVSAFLFAELSFAQDQPGASNYARSLMGKQCLTVNIGLASQSTSTVNTTGSNFKSGFLGSVSYNYWTTDEWAMELNAGLMNAEVQQGYGIGGIQQNSAAIFPIFVGARYYPASMIIGNGMRPYASLLVGAVLGYTTSTGVFTPGSISFLGVGSTTNRQSTFGSRLGIGMDVFLSSWLKAGINTGYNLMLDFDQPVGNRKNYSGFDLSFSMGIML